MADWGDGTMRINWYKLIGLNILDAVIAYHFSIDKSTIIIILMAIVKVFLSIEMRERI